MLSKRVSQILSKPSAIMEGVKLASLNPYSLKNPKGYLNFGVAENHLLNEMLLTKLNEPLNLKAEHIHYSSLSGIDSTKNVLKSFLEKYLGLKELNQDFITIQNGVSALCESLSYALFDEADEILIPAPFYPGFVYDFESRFKCKLNVVQMNPGHDFKHEIDPFVKSYNDNVKGVLITHPSNPTGENLSIQFFEDICNFCLEHDLELICDEIYALSQIGNEFQSLYQYARDKKVKAHLLYGLAKDFCLGGQKFGIYYSEHEKLVKAMQTLCYFHTTSTATQKLVENLLSDEIFLTKYITKNQKQLSITTQILLQELSMYKWLRPDAGLFCLLDMSDFCASFEEETELYQKFINYIRINMTPGKSLGLERPGYFRVCYMRSKHEVLEFIVRMKMFYENELAK